MTTQPKRRLRHPPFKFLAVQCAALLMASMLLVVGILGFVPGVTTAASDMHWINYQPGVALFGVFAVSVLHNLFHITVGIAGLVLARTYGRARAYLLAGGAVFVGLWIHGLVAGSAAAGADNWLHFGLGVAMIILAVTLAGARVPTGARGEELPTAIE